MSRSTLRRTLQQILLNFSDESILLPASSLFVALNSSLNSSFPGSLHFSSILIPSFDFSFSPVQSPVSTDWSIERQVKWTELKRTVHRTVQSEKQEESKAFAKMERKVLSIFSSSCYLSTVSSLSLASLLWFTRKRECLPFSSVAIQFQQSCTDSFNKQCTFIFSFSVDNSCNSFHGSHFL